MGDRLEDLLVAPIDLARLFEQVMGRAPVGLEQRLEEGQQGRLAGIGRAPAAGPRDLVEAEPRGARRPGVLGDRVGVAAILGDRESDPLAACAGGRTPPRSSWRIRAKARSAAGEPASTPTNFETEPPALAIPWSSLALASGAVSSSWM